MLKLQPVSTPEAQESKGIAIDREVLLLGRDPPPQPGAQVLALPDPRRVISRLHARIEYRNGGYYLIDTSTNGVFVNDSPRPVGRGNEVELHDGDCLTIGDYRIQVSLSSGTAEIEATQMVEPPQVGATEAGRDFWDEASPVAPSGEGESHAEEPFDIPEDLFAGLDQVGKVPDEPSGAPPADLMLGSPLEEAFPASSPPETVPPSKKASASPDSPEALKPVPPVRDQRETGALEAFLAGAALEGKVDPGELPEDFLRSAGALMRIMVQGLMDLLRSRARIKNELRLDMTVLGAVENNPLKFSVTADDVLLHLLKPAPGYLHGEEAVREAVDDLAAHQVAVISGMQAALKAVLRRFDPQVLEQKAEKLYPLASHLPLQRRAKLWSLFEQSYAEIGREVEEDFLALFGRLFAEAYEEQAALLRRRRP